MKKERTHFLDGTNVSHVVSDDLSKLGKVPAEPLLATHDVIVQLLVEIVEKRHGLDDHRVYFVRAELQLVTGQAGKQTNHVSSKIQRNATKKCQNAPVSQTQGHGSQLLVRNLQQTVGLRTDAPHQL